MFCPQCGTNVGGARFCPNCGSAIAAGQPYGDSRVPPAPPPPPPRRSVVPAVLVALGAAVVLVLLASIVWLVRDNGGTQTAQNAAASPTATRKPSLREPARTQATKKPATTPTSGPGDVRGLPAGLFCRDLNARGFSYVAAVDYWRMHGQPNQMDVDRNGIPCETVYPASDVTAYWSGRGLPNLALAGGLFCRDLFARGVSYPEAVAYWWTNGMPDRMDADLNGIPCETVYPASEVYDFWYR